MEKKAVSLNRGPMICKLPQHIVDSVTQVVYAAGIISQPSPVNITNLPRYVTDHGYWHSLRGRAGYRNPRWRPWLCNCPADTRTIRNEMAYASAANIFSITSMSGMGATDAICPGMRPLIRSFVSAPMEPKGPRKP